MKKRIIVVGGGASGMMAAVQAADASTEVLLLEKTPRLGKKLLLSGKTRCNITNSATEADFQRAYGANGKWLRNVFAQFFREELLTFLTQRGLACKEERGGRIFPVSDAAADVLLVFQRELAACGVKVLTNCAVQRISVSNGRVSGVTTGGGEFPASAVILATGGASYPQTGSTGDGFRLAKALGHSLVRPTPALVPLVVQEQELVRAMQGVSLKNVRLSAFACASEEIVPSLIPSHDVCRESIRRARPPLLESRFGEMLFTHFGIGGPIVLRMSLSINNAMNSSTPPPRVSVAIDLKPALSHRQLEQRLQRDFDTNGKKTLPGVLAGLLPSKMISPCVALWQIDPARRACDFDAAVRAHLATCLKLLRFNIVGSLPLSRAIVTAGGVSLPEVNPRTLESLRIRGLFFCGETLDIDADTGGYNLQAAFSTGFVAGSAAKAAAGENGGGTDDL